MFPYRELFRILAARKLEREQKLDEARGTRTAERDNHVWGAMEK